jgi:hypothetical protein
LRDIDDASMNIFVVEANTKVSPIPSSHCFASTLLA